ncbi:benzoate/H(+) symporter BenE family transporter [Marinactinospora thermotolerans]|uniref:benzoate/H(+) symporter BenE family transporter n=1 Tax=Marinactinospora thermotolerans TaxID=531310 RepID=UPI003D8BE8D7
MSDSSRLAGSERLHLAGAGLVAALVGFSSSFVIVLAGLRAVGATQAQAASGLFVLCLAIGVAMLWLGHRYRIPITLAWSTPGAALLASTGEVAGGWPAAVGAFLLVGALVVLSGLVAPLGRAISQIPVPLAQAMLAGVLLSLCLAPVQGVAQQPLLVGPVVLVWLVMLVVARRWAVPAALFTALVVALGALRGGGAGVDPAVLLPVPEWTTPALTWQAVASVALPLFVVTMASQNVPGTAVLASFGYRTPWRSAMVTTGAATVLTGPFGGFAVNLAAISAALAAGPQAHPDPARRWRAAVAAGWSYLLLAVLSAALAAVIAAAPAGLVEAAAGLALITTLAASLKGALEEESWREAAAVTFLVAASGVTVAGIGSAFWALLAGLLMRGISGGPWRARSTVPR